MASPRSAAGTSLTRLPSSRISPALGFSRPAMMRSSVDFPQPDGPTKTTNSPSRHVEVDVVDHLDRSERFGHLAEAQIRHCPLI